MDDKDLHRTKLILDAYKRTSSDERKLILAMFENSSTDEGTINTGGIARSCRWSYEKTTQVAHGLVEKKLIQQVTYSYSFSDDGLGYGVACEVERREHRHQFWRNAAIWLVTSFVGGVVATFADQMMSCLRWIISSLNPG